MINKISNLKPASHSASRGGSQILEESSLIKPSSRMTNQRLEIISYLQSTREHPTAEKIFKEVRKKLPKISLATVYRNLVVLEEKGLIARLCIGKDRDRYDGNAEEHFHFVCQLCHRIMDVPIPDAFQVKERIENQGYKINKMSIHFYGICGICNKLK